MAGIVDNRLLVNTFLGIAVYWLFGMFMPNPYVSSVASLVLLCGGSLLMYRYSRATYAIVFKGDRSPEADEQGSHLAVYGAWLVATGAVYTGIFALAWILSGQSPQWVGTATSGFGRALMASGFVLMYMTPDAMRGPNQTSNAIILVLLFLVSVIGAFIAGANLSGNDAASLSRFIQFHGGDRPICAEDRPIWGSGRYIYHMPDSRYRDMVIPTRCFKTVEEATIAGFRKAD